MNFDLDTIYSWLQSLLRDQEGMAKVGSILVCLVAATVSTGLTWLLSRLGWGSLKLAGRGARACCRTSPEALLGYELGEAVVASLKQTVQPASKESRMSMKFGDGEVWLCSGDIYLRGESIRHLLPRRPYKRILQEARALAARLDREASTSKKKKFLEVLQPCQGKRAEETLARAQARDDAKARLLRQFEVLHGASPIDLAAPPPK